MTEFTKIEIGTTLSYRVGMIRPALGIRPGPRNSAHPVGNHGQGHDRRDSCDDNAGSLGFSSPQNGACRSYR
jgi:hypothetical protein